jgi:hypothetical protein
MTGENENRDADATRRNPARPSAGRSGRAGAQGGYGPLPVRGVSYEPSRRDRLRPVELVGFSAVIALFVGLVTLMATREWTLSGVAFGVVFIITLVVLAMFSLSFKPNAEEAEDLDEQDHGPRA